MTPAEQTAKILDLWAKMQPVERELMRIARIIGRDRMVGSGWWAERALALVIEARPDEFPALVKLLEIKA